MNGRKIRLDVIFLPVNLPAIPSNEAISVRRGRVAGRLVRVQGSIASAYRRVPGRSHA
jgi:hypothetical protein